MAKLIDEAARDNPRSWNCFFKKCIEVLAATDGFITSCWSIWLWSQPVTCSHDPLLAVTTRYFQVWNKAISKVTNVLHWWNSPVAIPSAHKTHRSTLCWISGESWWMFGAFASCAALFCLLVVHADRTGLRVFIRCADSFKISAKGQQKSLQWFSLKPLDVQITGIL